MKKILILTLIGATILSCSNDDDNQDDISHQIIGDWKLLETKFYGLEIIEGEGSDEGYSGEGSIDYRNENIVYRFQANGTLIVSGGENAGYSNGEYQYLFGYDLWGPSVGSPILLVKINDGELTYNLTNGIMTLGLSYVDGPDLVFERVKGRE